MPVCASKDCRELKGGIPASNSDDLTEKIWKARRA